MLITEITCSPSQVYAHCVLQVKTISVRFGRQLMHVLCVSHGAHSVCVCVCVHVRVCVRARLRLQRARVSGHTAWWPRPTPP